jgi:hypothetical protein
MKDLWPQSFPDVVQIAERYRAAGQHLAAAGAFQKAASLAPDAEHEDAMLRRSWVARERACGRMSGLEES